MDNKVIKAPLLMAVATPKGGCGKTTIAAQLAVFFAVNHLACQVEITDNMEGMVVNLPASQF